MTTMEYILVICTLALGHSLYSAVALLVLSRKLSNRLLALLLFLLALRIGKSVLQMFFRPGMSYELSVIGVTAMACIGPVTLLLIRSLFNSSLRITARSYLHFIPGALLPFTLPLSDWKILSPAYYSMTAHVFVYLSLAWGLAFRQRELFKTDDLKWQWALILLAGITVLAITFVLQITVYQPAIYVTNIIIAAVVFYGLSLWSIRRSRIFLPEAPAKSDNVAALAEMGKRIERLLEDDQLFIDAHLTVSKLSQKLKAQPYLVSKAINHYFKKSFSELLIQYRIRKAEQLLLAPDTRVYTIEAIAFESGFNTLSAFYAAFKKIHKMTPAQFREAQGNTNMKIA
jgi:AraC-like DNA-binding protein